MATKSPSTTNLLSKFTQMFRDPSEEASSETSTRPHLSASEAERAFKEMIKRKRRDDAIRKREFDHLRAVLKGAREPGQLERVRHHAGSPAPARSSGPAPLERNSILEKIDGAQAHIEQWWGTPKGGPAGPASPPAAAPAPAADDDLDLDFTGMMAVTGEAPLEHQTDPAPVDDERERLSPLENALREAALNFAEAHFEDAHDTLQAMLASPEIDAAAAETLTYSLFEIFRCANQQTRFDALALEYAKRYGRSPGEWFAIPAQAAPSRGPAAATPGARAAATPVLSWTCPPLLERRALSICAAQQAASQPMCAIQWQGLQQIEPGLAPDLFRLLGQWRDQPLILHWQGLEALLAAVRARKQDPDAVQARLWWQVEMLLLYLAQRDQAYEEAALAYCMAYEVSPPTWPLVRCKWMSVGLPAPAESRRSAPAPDSTPADVSEEQPFTHFDLHGNITGETPPELEALRMVAQSVDQISIACARLGRIDLNAASALLKWVAECDARGCAVQFTQVPRLVMVLFQMLDLHKLASLSTGSH